MRPAGPCGGRGASTHHQLHQCAWALDRPSVPEPVLVGADGRKPLIAAVRHVSLNPVRARLARKAEDGAWSSVRAHLTRQHDELVSVAPVRNRVDQFAALLESDSDDGAFRALRSSEAGGRPLGNADFIADLERLLGPPIARRAPGRKSKRARSGAVGSTEVRATENRYHVAVFPSRRVSSLAFSNAREL